MEEFVGAAEIGMMFGGLSRQRVTQITGMRDFPAPFQTLKSGRIWRRTDVEAWGQDNRPAIDAE